MVIIFLACIILTLSYFLHYKHNEQENWFNKYCEEKNEKDKWKNKYFDVKFGKNFNEVKHLIKNGTLATAYSLMSESECNVKFHIGDNGEISVSFLGTDNQGIFGCSNVDESSSIYGIKIKE